MPPGRPKIYKTPEEKVLANRAKSKHSYHKNKDPSKVCSTPKRPAGSGRPRLYHTLEEKMYANWAKSKRSYHKKILEISCQRAIRYRAATIKNWHILAAVRDRKHPKNKPTTVTNWMALVSDTSDKFDTLLQGVAYYSLLTTLSPYY
ncbi:hypothetical protein PC9H_011456 [Pleurotus ostreatus]|uniref:Uncharacterized protein n=1 Tax=Pleurotus ostreatus TaxID=5322 RepID=A0A8H6ZNK9_PLEOS|nr:uncharacterized protein PC9H_011456 [Pleurotus ostreatus]KAF7420937.1 hypothetical protein PC9H_011456 [Pleurotus ostreatus]